MDAGGLRAMRAEHALRPPGGAGAGAQAPGAGAEEGHALGGDEGARRGGSGVVGPAKRRTEAGPMPPTPSKRRAACERQGGTAAPPREGIMTPEQQPDARGARQRRRQRWRDGPQEQPDAELEAAAVAAAARRGAAPAQPPVLPALPALHVRLGRTVAPSPKPVRHVARPLFGRGPTQAELDEFFGAAEAEEAERFAARWGFDVRTERPTQTAAQTGWEWSTVGE